MILELENRLILNSSNCSIPPSKDSFFNQKNPKSSKPSPKKPVGQECHAGIRLLPVENPNIVMNYRLSLCFDCGCTIESREHITIKKSLRDIRRDLSK